MGCGELSCNFDEMWSAAGDPGSSQVNPENFDRVEMYMSYQEVAAIFGEPGYLTWKYTLAGHTTENYDWVGYHDYTVTVSFTDGVVTDKAWYVAGEPGSAEPEAGERREPSYRRGPAVSERRASPPSPGVTFANFERIRFGMTYPEVAAAFGGEGKFMGSRWIGNTELKEYEWRDDYGGIVLIDFTRGTVCRRYQRGLK
jgi:hypothetical protein